MSIINNKLLIASQKQDITSDEIRDEINKFSTMIERMTLGVINDSWHLVLMGDPGQGKTQTVVDTIMKHKVNVAGIKGTTSAIGLYKFFYEHKDHDVIVIDDSDAIYDIPEATEMLKAAMDSKDVRKVSWAKQNTNLQAMGIPSEFTINARIILISNKDLEHTSGRVSKAQRLMKPVMDRAPKFKTGLPNREWEIEYFEMMHEQNNIVCFKERGLNADAQKEVMSFIIENNEKFSTLSFRLIDKICAFYNDDKKMWKELALMTLV